MKSKKTRMPKISELQGIKEIQKQDKVSEGNFVDTSSGEVLTLVRVVSSSKNVSHKDCLNFTKLYPEGSLLMTRISQPALRLLVHILNKCLQKDCYVFTLAMIPAMNDCGWSTKSSFYRAVKELEKEKFMQYISGTQVLGVFEINPNMVFNGNRLKNAERD